MTGQRVRSEEQLNAMFAEAADLSSLGTRRRIPGVLDTDFIRDGLQNQLTWKNPPSTVRSARAGSLRLFMEYDTLTETREKLPKFAGQLGVPVAELRRILNEDWLPHVEVVQLPPSLRAVDPRALAVRDRDAADYPLAALAALLSPCLLLTRNYKHFGPLGVRTYEQGRGAVADTNCERETAAEWLQSLRKKRAAQTLMKRLGDLAAEPVLPGRQGSETGQYGHRIRDVAALAHVGDVRDLHVMREAQRHDDFAGIHGPGQQVEADREAGAVRSPHPGLGQRDPVVQVEVHRERVLCWAMPT